MAKTFEQRLDEALSLNEPAPQAYTAMTDSLNEVARSLQKQIEPSAIKAQIAVEPGHLVDAGQQFNVVIHIPSRNRFHDTLFRAYIPALGEPVTLDFIGDEPELVRTPAEMQECVIQFLSRPQIRNMIRTFRDLAANAP